LIRQVLVAIADQDQSKAQKFADRLKKPPPVVSVPQLARMADLVVEAASPAAVADILPEVIARGKDVLVLSIGGLIENEAWLDQARKSGSTIYCPSGAIAGLDAVKAGAIGQIRDVLITSRKSPQGLEGAPYLKEHAIDLDGLDSPRIVFDGTAREACRGFPQNVNVSAALSLAGIGADRTRVRIVVDPDLERNVHEIEVRGDFGRIHAVTENTPSENPKTSLLAALSAVALLKSITGSLRVGT
jgi:aspartate dehydrogenase